jgi:hypothetical protein
MSRDFTLADDIVWFPFARLPRSTWLVLTVGIGRLSVVGLLGVQTVSEGSAYVLSLAHSLELFALLCLISSSRNPLSCFSFASLETRNASTSPSPTRQRPTKQLARQSTSNGRSSPLLSRPEEEAVTPARLQPFTRAPLLLRTRPVRSICEPVSRLTSLPTPSAPALRGRDRPRRPRSDRRLEAAARSG